MKGLVENSGNAIAEAVEINGSDTDIYYYKDQVDPIITKLEEENKRWLLLCKDIVTILGNHPYMFKVCADEWIEKMYDTEFVEETNKLADDVLQRLLKVKPHEWCKYDKEGVDETPNES